MNKIWTSASAKLDVLAVLASMMEWPLAWRLGAAVAAVIPGVTLRYFVLGGLEGRLIFITLFPAVAVAAGVSGVAGGVVAAILCAIAALALSPPMPLNTALLGVGAFFFSSAVIIGFSELLRMAMQKTAAADMARKGKEQLNAFVEHAPAAMAMLDADMRYLALSARWRSDYNLGRDILGKSHYEVFPKITDDWKEIYRRALAGETLRSKRDAFERGDGSVQWVRWAVQPWRDPLGAIGGIIIFSEDITDKVRSRELLREGEQNKAFLLGLSDSLQTLRDPAQIIAEASKHLAQRLGCNQLSYAEMDEQQEFATIKSEWSDGSMPTSIGVHRLADYGAFLAANIKAGRISAIGDTEQDTRTCEVAATFRARSIRAFLSMPLVREGRLITILSAQCAQARHWSKMEVELAEAVAERIGALVERARAKQALRDSERQFKAVFDTSMEGIITIDKAGVIQAANPAAAEMYGYEAGEMLGRNVDMLMPETNRARHNSYLAKYLRTGAKNLIGHRLKLDGLRKNGEIFLKELTVTEASDSRDVLYIGFMRDLTQIENEKRQTEAARAELLHVARLSDMSEAAAGLAHEVSQPLTAIQTLAVVGRRALSSTTEPSLARVIELIETEARNAAAILKRLRGFIEKRESRHNLENLAKLIEDALALASLRCNGSRARILVKPSPDALVVDVDRIQILQVLTNFLRNASEALAGQPDPEVVIETLLEKPGVVRVNVSDNGPGVDPKVADRLFTPFVTTKSTGMGVGLSLCKTIVQSHNGEIGCAANTPKGAIFWFTLPVIKGESSNAT